MKTSIKSFACAAAASIAFFSCDINNSPSSTDPNDALLLASSSSSLSGKILCTDDIPGTCYICTDTECYRIATSSSSSSLDIDIPLPMTPIIPVMDSRVVSHKKGLATLEYAYTLEPYGNGFDGFTKDKEVLKSWFPEIFNGEPAKSECNYFALYFSTYSSPFDHYLILSQDMALNLITCNDFFTGIYARTEDFIKETMLICDDNAGTLRKSINLDSIRNYTIQNWDCQSGIGGPKPEDVFFKGKTQPNIKIPEMDSRVVSYQRPWNRDGDDAKLGYGNGFTTDKDILKFWFPDIFNDESAKSECNYFALYFTNSSSGLVRSYEILSQDMVYMIGCTWKGTGVSTGDFARRAMLICDDKAGTLRKSIDLDSIRFYNDPDWECESGEGGPNWEDMYF